MFCSKCGNPNEDSARFCQSCGEPLQPQTISETVPSNTNSQIQFQTTISPFAGFWIRAAAYLIDGLVLVIPSILLQLALHTVGSLVELIISWLYFALMESSSKQATLGKMALGLRVVDKETGQRIHFGQATGRYFAKIVSGLTLYIGFMMAGWTEQKQALHDKMASTLVMRRGF